MCPPSGGVLRANQMEKVRKSSVVLPHDGGHHDVHLNDVNSVASLILASFLAFHTATF
jgi:hypothetical protein